MTKQNKPIQQSRQVSHVSKQLTMRRSGPLPDPGDMEYYEKIQPGFADRIMVMAEKEQADRQDKERMIINLDDKQHKRGIDTFRIGQVLALVSVLLVMGLCVFFLYLGFANQAATVAVSVMVALAGVFIIGNTKKPPTPPPSTKED